MGDIIKLGKSTDKPEDPPDKIIWSCGECGCTSWFVYQEYIQCTHCQNISTTCAGKWRQEPPGGMKITEVAERTFSETGVDNSEFLLKNFMKKMTEDDVMIIIKPDGRVATYNGITPEKTSKKWLKSRLAKAFELIDPRKK